MITQISTSTCETEYAVKLDNGETVNLKLWIVTGGEPALDFSTYGFTKRFPALEKWGHSNEVGTGKDCIGHVTGFTHYKHQGSRSQAQGPTIGDDLPNGTKDVFDFLRDNLANKILMEKRIKELTELHGDTIQSKRKHDKDNSTYVYAKLDLYRHFISPVTFTSGCYWGRADEAISLFPAWWNKAQELFNPPKEVHRRWYEITEEEYQTMKRHIEAYKGE